MMALPYRTICANLLLLQLLVTCGAARQSHLRRVTSTSNLTLDQGVQPPGVELDPAMVAGMKMFFTLQYVGVQTRGVPQPRSPLSPEGKKCITAQGRNSLSGYGLKLVRCSDADLAPPGMKVDRSIQDLQAFHFLNNGQIRNKMTGLCIRRMLCGLTPVYDLGPCDQDQSATSWLVNKAVANSMEDKQFLGYPLIAIVKDMCNMCGPYQMLQKCKGEPMTGVTGGCHSEESFEPGWTKNPSAFILPKEDTSNSFSVLGTVIGAVDVAEEMDGIMETPEKEGFCGTWLVDGPSAESWFYFLKVGK